MSIATVQTFLVEEEVDETRTLGGDVVAARSTFEVEATVVGAASRREALQAVLVKVQQELDA